MRERLGAERERKVDVFGLVLGRVGPATGGNDAATVDGQLGRGQGGRAGQLVSGNVQCVPVVVQSMPARKRMAVSWGWTPSSNADWRPRRVVAVSTTWSG